MWARQKIVCNVSDFNGQFAEDRYLEYLNSIHQLLTSTETQFMAQSNYLSFHSNITEKDREKQINWLIELQVQFKLLPETLFITVNIIDRFLSKKRIDRDKLQLLGATAMLIASKFQEIYPPVINDFVHMCADLYTREEICRMETLVLTTIEYDVNCTPSQTFLEVYARAILISDRRVLVFASFLLDIALLKVEFL